MALNYTRSKTQAVFVQILDKRKSNIKPYLTFGIITIIYGIGIYYFLPMAMLTMNFKLLLRVFFLILLAMLLGLSLLAFNI